MWEQRQRHHITVGEDWFPGENQHYLLWFHRVARTRWTPHVPLVDGLILSPRVVDLRLWLDHPPRIGLARHLHPHSQVTRACLGRTQKAHQPRDSQISSSSVSTWMTPRQTLRPRESQAR
ncbi:hypothetical protein HU200_008841 [Digitaria exilis]|uniref:Uncharacterized protein n=1 Tax=Digitaria exilis TaxID=1010633 RepID=A0A835FN41_9POAL|nr:hypothetical protein HU200_008841 [Digitaria exilis]